MSIQSIAAAIVLFAVPSLALATDGPPAQVFLQEVNGAFYSCSRLIGEGEMNNQMYGSSAPSSTGRVLDCASTGSERVKVAYDAYVALQPKDDAKAAAKEVYIASLAYADAIRKASSRSDLDNGNAQAGLSRAKAVFIVDSGL